MGRPTKIVKPATAPRMRVWAVLMASCKGHLTDPRSNYDRFVATGHGIGYLLKTRVTDVADFVGTLERVSKGASVVDPALVQELVSARRRDDPLAVLSPREQEVLMQMAEGRSNAGIARRLWVTEGTVEKHVRSILTKLGLAEAGDDHRRVLAVLTFLEAR